LVAPSGNRQRSPANGNFTKFLLGIAAALVVAGVGASVAAQIALAQVAQRQTDAERISELEHERLKDNLALHDQRVGHTETVTRMRKLEHDAIQNNLMLQLLYRRETGREPPEVNIPE